MIRTPSNSRLANIKLWKRCIGDIISCFSAISDFPLRRSGNNRLWYKKYIYMSANDKWRTQQVEIVELVEKRRNGDDMIQYNGDDMIDR